MLDGCGVLLPFIDFASLHVRHIDFFSHQYRF